MFSQAVLAVTLLFAVGSEATESRHCRNLTVPVSISAQTTNLKLDPPRVETDIVDFVLNTVQQGRGWASKLANGTKSRTGTYNISATYCEPLNVTNSSKPFIQFLTHGAGFDRTYWDIAFNDYNYSYVNTALSAGYCTFSYDRLGIGNSSHGDPINEIQAPLEMAAMRELTKKLRQGTISGIPHAFGDKVVHVGHSAGSGQTFAFAATFPNETAGIVLTGFALNSTFGSLFNIGASYQDAAKNQPLRFGNVNASILKSFLSSSPLGDLTDVVTPIDNILDQLPQSLNYAPGYITWKSIANQMALFFHPPNFDPAILTFQEGTKQPGTYGEMVSGDSPPTGLNPFEGPVLVMTGENDLPFCGGDCFATGNSMPNIPASVELAFGGNKSNFEAHIQPQTGHGLTGHFNATAGYKVIQTFLKRHDLY